jgi:hypothetical protein
MSWFEASDGCWYDIIGPNTVMLMQIMSTYPSTLVFDSITKDGINYLITSLNGDVLRKSGITDLTLTNVTSIPMGAFNGIASLRKVQIPQLLVVPVGAFSRCTGLETISFPLATEIGNGSFDGCTNLLSVSLPSAKTIGIFAFRGCIALRTMNGNETYNNINVPNLITIQMAAFFDHAFISIHIPSTVTSIQHAAFLRSNGNKHMVDVFFTSEIPEIAVGRIFQLGMWIPDGCCFSTIDMSTGTFSNDIANTHYNSAYYTDRLPLLFKSLIQTDSPPIGLMITNGRHNTMNAGSTTVRNYRAKYKRS